MPATSAKKHRDVVSSGASTGTAASAKKKKLGPPTMANVASVRKCKRELPLEPRLPDELPPLMKPKVKGKCASCDQTPQDGETQLEVKSKKKSDNFVEWRHCTQFKSPGKSIHNSSDLVLFQIKTP